jgi:uncharacterized protein YxjI
VTGNHERMNSGKTKYWIVKNDDTKHKPETGGSRPRNQLGIKMEKTRGSDLVQVNRKMNNTLVRSKKKSFH